ncbi:hypothetical protein PFMALIP_01733, partial [Plasmodium falciparum MaliPS096_E11]
MATIAKKLNERLWIDKKKEEFDKQKNKYDKEIKKYINEASGIRRQKRGASTTNYDGYEKKFYKELQSNGYGTIDKFLEKLSAEDVCKRVEDDKGGTIHFEKVNSGSASVPGGGTSDTSGTNDENKGTFYRSKYCQPCPHCGVKREGNDWKEKNNDNCKRGNLYRPNKDAPPTPINFLYSGEGETEIKEKLEAFCEEKNGSDGGGGGGNSEKKELYDEWKCYEFKQLTKVGEGEDDDLEYNNDVQNAGGLCILKKEKKGVEETNSQKEPDEIQKTYNDFFNFWVAHMLKDSIYWRTKKLDKCINNTNGKQTKCKNGCNTKCECFKRWVEQKKEKEWKPIKDHFGKQEDMRKQIGKDTDPGIILEGVLKLQFLNENNEEKSENSLNAQEAEELKHLRQMLQETAVVNGVASASGSSSGGVTEQKTIMDKLIEHEENEATKCKDCEQPKAPTAGGGARSLPDEPTEDRSQQPDDDDEEEDDEDGDEGAGEGEGDGQESEETVEEEPPAVENPEENTVAQPKICPEQAPPKQEEEDGCKPAAEETVPSSDENQPETPVIKPEEEAPAPDVEPPPPAPAAPPEVPKEDKKATKPKKPRIQHPNPWEHPIVIPSLATSTLMWTVGIGFATFTYFFLKKKTKSSVGNLFQILQIPKSDYDIPTKLSPNRYIPYTSGKYRGKRYIYLEGDSGTDSGYTDHYSDITSSESEYEEMDINDIYVPGSPKYKTLIEVVLEPSKRDTQNDIHNDIPSDIPSSDTPPPITDDEWNKLKKDFISNMLQNTQNTEPNILRDNVDNNTHPTTSHHNVEEKPFIMSIHDRNLFSGEEYNYDMFNSGNNPINISDSTN